MSCIAVVFICCVWGGCCVHIACGLVVVVIVVVIGLVVVVVVVVVVSAIIAFVCGGGSGLGVVGVVVVVVVVVIVDGVVVASAESRPRGCRWELRPNLIYPTGTPPQEFPQDTTCVTIPGTSTTSNPYIVRIECHKSILRLHMPNTVLVNKLPTTNFLIKKFLIKN